MAIVLSDIRNAVQTYLNTKVSIAVSAVTPDVPGTMNPNEEGTFNVTVSNASILGDGIRLINVRYRLSVNNILKLKVPSAVVATARATANASSPALSPGTFVSEMFLFPADNRLEVGDIDTLVGLKVKAASLGVASISCRILADADMDYIFPKDEDSAIATRSVSIV